MMTEIEEFFDKYQEDLKKVPSFLADYGYCETLDVLWEVCGCAHTLLSILMCEKNNNYDLSLVRYIVIYCLNLMLKYNVDNELLRKTSVEYIQSVAEHLMSFADGKLDKENLVKKQQELSTVMSKAMSSGDTAERGAIYGSHLALAWVVVGQIQQAAMHATTYSFNFLKSKNINIDGIQVKGLKEIIGNPYFFGGSIEMPKIKF
jgi:hypothetical protein